MNTLSVVSVLASAFVVSAPPILPFTELSDKKIATALEHMTISKECTATDCNVFLQLDHIQWKYKQMREAFYRAAREAKDGSVVDAKDLGKMFDKIDAVLDEQREKDLQRIEKELESRAKNQLNGRDV
jgi:hypothetical protein